MVDCMDRDGPGMASPPRILVIGDDEDTFESKAMLYLRGLQVKGLIELEQVYAVQFNSSDTGVIKEVLAARFEEDIQTRLKNCQALVCRPTMMGTVTELMVKDVNLPFYLATLSKGTDHIKIPKDKLREVNDKESESEKITLIHAGDENAPAVAELAIQLANLLMRQTHRFAWAVNSQRFDNRISRGSRRLEGLTWLTVGAGAQIPYLLERLLNWRLERFIIQTRHMDVERFRRLVEPILRYLNNNEEHRVNQILNQIDDSMQVKIPTVGGSEMSIVGVNDLDTALPQANVVSIHLPLEREGPTPTLHLFNESRLGKMKEGAFLINVSRGDIVVEEHVLNALNEKRLAGYAADVINGAAEESKDLKDSLLWRIAVQTHNESNEAMVKDRNILLTPHVGGSTNDAIEAVAHNVVSQLLGKLGLTPIPA